MESYNVELLKTFKQFDGLAEIPGPKDQPLIELAHRLTNIEGPKGGLFTDEIPWCSSMMTLVMLITSAKINPGRVLVWMKKRDADIWSIKYVFNLAGYPDLSKVPPDNGILIPEPTWSPRAISYSKWCAPVLDKKKLQPGDLMVFLRKGGAHVCLYEAQNFWTYTVYGANQNNRVGSSNRYLKAKLITARRFTL